MAAKFQNTPSGGLTVDPTSMTLTIVDPGGITPTMILKESAAFDIKLKWELGGPDAFWMIGTWKARISFEQLGTGEGPAAEEVTKPFAGAGAYSATLNVPAGLPLAVGETATVYQAVVTLTAVQADGVTPMALAGYFDEQIIQVFRPGP